MLSANPAISLAYAQSVYLDAVNLAAPGSCSVCFGAGVCQTGVDCTSPDQIWFANPVNGIYPNASGVAFLGSGGVNGSATAQTTADPTAGIANTNVRPPSPQFAHSRLTRARSAAAPPPAHRRTRSRRSALTGRTSRPSRRCPSTPPPAW